MAKVILPSQTGASAKILKSDGTNAAWSTLADAGIEAAGSAAAAEAAAKAASDPVGSAAAAETAAKAASDPVGTAAGLVGTLANLLTTVKTNVVAAINEIVGLIGSLAGLTTTAKTSAVAAINEVNQGVGNISKAFTSTGTLNALAVDTDGTFDLTKNGAVLNVIPAYTNSGATTIAVDGQTAKAVKKWDVATSAYVDLAAGDLRANSPYTLTKRYAGADDFFLVPMRNGANVALVDAGNYFPSAKNAELALQSVGSQLAQTQAQIDVLVVDGDSSVEAAQARVNADAYTFVTLKARLDDSDVQLDKLAANSDTAVIASGAGVSPETITFNVASIIRKNHQTLPIYENNFEFNPNDTYVNELTKYDLTAGITSTWSAKQIALAYSGAAGAQEEAIFKTCNHLQNSSFSIELDVLTDGETGSGFSGTFIRTGICKDASNWLLLDYNKYSKIIQFIGKASGTFFSLYWETIPYVKYDAPYRLIMLVNNNIATAIIRKDGIDHYLYEYYFGAKIDLLNPAVLSGYSPCYGTSLLYNNQPLTINGFYAYYSSGQSVGADFKAITYEDGCPIRDGNSIYVTGTSHSTTRTDGASASNIYKLNMASYSLDFVGQIVGRKSSDGMNFGGGSPKVFYDRNQRYWVVVLTDFVPTTPHSYIGTTKNNLLSGIHIISMQEFNVPNKTSATWDFDIIFDSTDGLYHGVYTSSGGTETHITASSVLGAWSYVASSAYLGGEGTVFFRANGKYYISKSDENDLGLKIYDYPALNYVGITPVNAWPCIAPSAVKVWGQIVSFNNGDITEFYMILHSSRKWAAKTYGYGEMWIYKGTLTETGLEFKEQKVLGF